MAEYIDREKVLALGYWHGEHPDFDNPNPDGVDAVDVSDIEAIPAADVAEVVRCKDCEYLVNTTINANGFLICDISDMEIAPDDFCSYGERREE